MPLVLVSELLVHGGFLPQLAALDNQKKSIFTKKNGVVFGVFWFIFLTMFSTAFFGIINAPDALIGVIAITGVFGSMMIILASLIFFRSSKPSMPFPQQFQAAPSQGLYGVNQTALPPQQSVPASAYTTPGPGTWRDTNDLQPTSVTENTTRLLNEDDR